MKKKIIIGIIIVLISLGGWYLYQENQRKIFEEKMDELVKTEDKKIQEIEKEYSTLEKNLEEKTKEWEAKELYIQEQKKKGEDAQKKWEDGSLSFFDSCGDSQLRDLLKNAKYVEYTKFGSEQDATSLKNMEISLDYIEYCNKIRDLEGLPHFLVSNEMMAMAQSNANAGAVLMWHSEQFKVAENLGWGLPDPYSAWYELEKTVMEYQKAHPDASKKEVAEALEIIEAAVQTGHYYNIVNREYTVTGYGYNSEPSYNSYGLTHCQDYARSSSTQTYTLEEYRELFNTYVENLKKDMESSEKEGKAAKKEAKALKKEIADLEEQVKEAKDTLEKAKKHKEKEVKKLEENF